MAEEKRKRKKWFSIPASREFREMEIGEIQAVSSENLIGKNITVSLSLLTNDMKKQNTKITFKIIDTKDKIKTQVKKIELQQTSVKRIARKGKNKIDDSFTAKTKDNVSIRIKPIFLTKNKTTKPVLTSIRKKAKALLTEKISLLNYSDLIYQIVNFRIQRDLRDKIKKIYPVSFYQIRSLIRIGGISNAASSNKS